MVQTDSFPILYSDTIVPQDFRAFAINLKREKCHFLQSLKCGDVIAVDSPAGWKIWRTGRGEPLHLNLFFVLSGTMNIHISGRSMIQRKGQVLLIPSWFPRIMEITEPCYHIYARFNQPEIFPHIQDVSLRHCGDSEAVAFYVQRLLLNRPSLSNEILYRSALLECLGVLFQRELQPHGDGAVSPKRDEILQYLQSAPGSALSVAMVAEQFHMSISSFRLFCLQNFRKSPSALIQEVKMLRACALLTYGKQPIERIAKQLGYADRFTFSKAFVRLNHVTPGEYRRKHNQLIEPDAER